MSHEAKEKYLIKEGGHKAEKKRSSIKRMVVVLSPKVKAGEETKI